MNNAKIKAIEGRGDISSFVVHLTRDDSKEFEDGAGAADNFTSIISDRKVFAFKPHCLHEKDIPEKQRRKFFVCCFSEVPLTELHLITKHIRGRQVRLSPYGVVFTREFLISKGAQPAIYINSYGNKKWLREAADRIFEIAKKGGFNSGKLWRWLPFLNAMHERYDFTWEREWRIRGDLEFTPKDIVCIILPEDGEDDWKSKFAVYGVPVISPGWSYERIVSELSQQARHARSHWVAKKSRVRRSKQER